MLWPQELARTGQVGQQGSQYLGLEAEWHGKVQMPA